MPRRPANQTGTGRKRTRTGCQRCRLRKIKCDERKPDCGQCRSRGYQCQTVAPLKWEEDYLSRGLAFGRTGIWSKSSSEHQHHQHHHHHHDVSTSRNRILRDQDTNWSHVPRIWPYSFVNATLEGSDKDHVALTTARSRWSASSRSAPTLSTSISRTPNFLPGLSDPLAPTLLSYYLERLCPLTVSSPTSTSPFASLIFPYSVSASPTLLESVLALSACHRAKHEAIFKDIALRLVGSVLRRLRHRLKTEEATKVALDSETLIVMVMLCLFEIVNECDERWVVHLRGARDLIRVRRQALLLLHPAPPWPQHQQQQQQQQQQQSTGDDELATFAEKFFAYQDVLGRTACGEAPIFGEDFWVSQHGVSSDITDPWLGCSPELVSILCEITALSRRRAEDAAVATDTTAFLVPTASLEARLGRLQQHVVTALHPADADDNILQTSAELKRLAAAFYLDCALRSAHPFLPASRVATSQILRLVSLLLERHVTAGLAWPIFVAAVELDPLEDPVLWTISDEEEGELEDSNSAVSVPSYGRPFVLYALDKMAGSSVSNVSQTRTVIERVWQSRDMEALQDINTKSSAPGQNDWERHVAPFCHGLSLG